AAERLRCRLGQCAPYVPRRPRRARRVPSPQAPADRRGAQRAWASPLRTGVFHRLWKTRELSLRDRKAQHARRPGRTEQRPERSELRASELRAVAPAAPLWLTLRRL